jgi:hypothetical protein
MASLLQSKILLDGIDQRIGDFLRAMEWKYRALAIESVLQA